ncbi:putative 37S ribosomal [Hyphodiscus hymeniophilus]|uniref:37S ribosomal n=1 Tax=Hyphodiscus hymeniophilus TaxID=353542 RepID=A0A9P6VT05_9HELO|nr:putative 37S ribosomal [Hyphodiscus hymeniophilus]
MPPRIPVPSRVSTLCFRPAAKSNGLPITSVANVATMAQRRKHKDPYALTQSKQRKSVNLARREVLAVERREAMGDPVRGVSTPFLESFDNVGGSAVLMTTTSTGSPKDGVQITTKNALLNHFLTPTELEESIKHSHSLTAPMEPKNRDITDPVKEAEEKQKHLDGHARATTALARIVSLANASQKDKTRANIQRCVETFGRHNTDEILRPRAAINPHFADKTVEGSGKAPRAGPDTGSSEVQIAVLTAKIRVLATRLEMKGGQKDKVNKRNLRVLVHKRQKLLQYLRRKERGGDRWTNLVGTLGLSEGTWKGEISL